MILNERSEHLSARIGDEHSGRRLDQVLPLLFTDFSRSRLQKWVKEGLVTRDGEQVSKPRERVYGGELIELQARMDEQVENRAQDIPLQLVYEDEALILVNKPAGLVVHPAAGNPDGTLQNALLHHDPQLIGLDRKSVV